ncbi:hypothetical protein ES703_86807 [subsurface metagenome]
MKGSRLMTKSPAAVRFQASKIARQTAAVKANRLSSRNRASAAIMPRAANEVSRWLVTMAAKTMTIKDRITRDLPSLCQIRGLVIRASITIKKKMAVPMGLVRFPGPAQPAR